LNWIFHKSLPFTWFVWFVFCLRVTGLNKVEKLPRPKRARPIQIFFNLAESDGSRRFPPRLLFEIVGTDGCIESRERSGDGLRRLDRTILACIGQCYRAATPLICFAEARASSPPQAGEGGRLAGR
jgi:hypothetical protein